VDADAVASRGRRAWYPSAPLERTAFAAAHALASAGTNTAHGGSRAHSDSYVCRSAATPAGGCRSAAGQREALAARRPRRPSAARAENVTPYPTSPFYQARARYRMYPRQNTQKSLCEFRIGSWATNHQVFGASTAWLDGAPASVLRRARLDPGVVDEELLVQRDEVFRSTPAASSLVWASSSAERA
jgi:hypothetical protein